MIMFWTYAGCRRPIALLDARSSGTSTDGEEPEHDEPAQARMRKTEDARDDEEAPRPERHDLEHADDVVDRRVVGAFLVAIVEPVDPSRAAPRAEGTPGRARPPRSARRSRRRLPPGTRTIARRYAPTSPTTSAHSRSRRMSQPRRLRVGGQASSISCTIGSLCATAIASCETALNAVLPRPKASRSIALGPSPIPLRIVVKNPRFIGCNVQDHGLDPRSCESHEPGSDG